MIILGIHDGHNATAAILVDGVVKACASEERFTRLKMDAGYPHRAIEYCLKEVGAQGRDLDQIAFATCSHDPLFLRVKSHATFTIEDWLAQEREVWRPFLYEKVDRSPEYRRRLREDDRFKGLQHFYDFSLVNLDCPPSERAEATRRLRHDAVHRHLGCGPEKVTCHNHHRAHAAYAYYANSARCPGSLVYTLDGGGDGSTAALFRSTPQGLRELVRTNDCHVARIYRSITLLLGMRVGHDEHKLMGLAPYATDRELERSWPVFKDQFATVDGVSVFKAGKPPDLFFHYQRAFEGHRFDGIAAATQRMAEGCVLDWVRSTTAQYGCRDIVFAGGVAMNVVANGLLAGQPFLDSVFVPASPADESLAIGAAYLAAERLAAERDDALETLTPLTDIYLGPSYDGTGVARLLERERVRERHEVTVGVSAAEVAEILAEGSVVARCAGRLEFGQRALGNRSILADPRRSEMVDTINRQIKYRDFWMPFAPSVLAERMADYFSLPGKTAVGSPYMMFVWPSTGLAQNELIAGLHPADKSGRPQVVRSEDNRDYYKLLRAFERKTGVGGLLNTSFNLHGEPICLTPEDALSTFERSGLDALLLNDVLIRRHGKIRPARDVRGRTRRNHG